MVILGLNPRIRQSRKESIGTRLLTSEGKSQFNGDTSMNKDIFRQALKVGNLRTKTQKDQRL